MEIDDKSFNLILDTLKKGFYITNLNREITHWNKSAEIISGFKSDEVIGTKCSDNVLEHIDKKGNSLCAEFCPLASTMSNGLPNSADVYLHHKNGHRVFVHIETSALLDSKNNIIGGIQMFNELNITNNYGEDEVDILTHLFKRKYISDKLKNLFREKCTHKIGIVRFDIDNFKKINKEHGIEAGNNILKLVSKNILSVSRPCDIYGRWDNDEFIGIIYDVSSEELFEIAELIRITTEQSYIKIGDNKISITLSVGGSLCKKYDYTLTLLERIDKLIYQSKKKGGNTLIIG